MLHETDKNTSVVTTYRPSSGHAGQSENKTGHRSKDCPGEGPINLAVDDLPHNSSATEWWYVNSHLETASGLELSLFASFFRIILGVDEETGKVRYAHALNWAISDPVCGKYYAESRVDRCAPEIGLERLERGEWKSDPLLRQALRELLEKGQVPHPDRLIDGPISVAPKSLVLDYGGNCFRKLEDGSYQLTLFDDEQAVGCELVFHPQIEPVRHGDNGIVRGVSGEEMFYYFIPKCRVEGTIQINNQSLRVKEGTGWYDHEFALSGEEAKQRGHREHNVAWNWISVQLDNGTEITAYDIFDGDENGQRCACWAIAVDPSGNRRQCRVFTFEPLECWTSARTFIEYPTSWRLEIPEVGLSLEVKAAFEKQEFITIISEPSFWEGRVNISGVMNGKSVSGLGFVERTWFDELDTLGKFFNAAGKQTRKAAQDLLPAQPTYEQARRLIASEEHGHYLEGVDLTQYNQSLIAPIREMVDRAGKAWRSYALLACIEAVGGNSQEFTPWLAIPELLHTGSLIIDDVEDRSSIRRGGPACHLIYGEPLAINAGCAAYYLPEILIHETRLTDKEKLRFYALYFEALRAAHAGQAADLAGLDALMPQVVESGDGRFLEERVLAIHRLKSAAPVRALSMVGATIGGGSADQVEAIGCFFEAIGLAFQIVDDTLNLRGFDNNLKSKGEDIAAGKVTIPVAKAMSRLPLIERRWLWETLSSKPADPAVIAAVIKQLEACGALEACDRQARELVESAWQRLEPLLRDSRVKVILRAFGWYVLERNY
jgi:geranylgeranyl pyrophosphate synthase/predicted secreted hydrolase